jgi:hypothetical protein
LKLFIDKLNYVDIKEKESKKIIKTYLIAEEKRSNDKIIYGKL